MSTGHRHHQLLQQVNNHSVNSSSSSSSNNNNTATNNHNNNNKTTSAASQPRESLRQRRKYDSKLSSQQHSSEGSQQSLELSSQPAQEGSPSERPVGTVMGIFFKVWSLVKVSKARNQRLRHQASDEPGHFEYIPAAKLAHSATSDSLNLSSVNPPPPPTPKHRLQVLQYAPHAQTPGTNSTSSGVSSGSSVRASSRKRMDSFASRCATATNHSAELSSAPKKSSWASRIKRSATSINQADFGARPSRWKRMSSEQAREPEEQQPFSASRRQPARAALPGADDDDSNNDIYSTPNDSIQSVAGSVSERVPFSFQPAQHHYQQPHQSGGPPPPDTQNRPFHMTKSFSATNFNHLLRAGAAGPAQFESIAETADPVANPVQAPRQRRLAHLNQNGTRFFISSSSSEDSNSAKAQQPGTARQPPAGEPGPGMDAQHYHQQRHLVSVGTSIALDEGVHCHQPARPDTLDLALASPPHCEAPMTPLELSLLEFGGAAARLPTSSNSHRPPYLLDYSNNHNNNNNTNNNWYPNPRGIPNSMSLFDCKLSGGLLPDRSPLCWSPVEARNPAESRPEEAEFELAQMLLESGNNPEARDSRGRSVLQLALLSDNLATLKCLLERGSVSIDASDADGCTALELACRRKPSALRLEIVRQLVAHGAQLDSASAPNSARLIDRLIGEHRALPTSQHRLAYVECLLQAGAKIGSATWAAARGKLDMQVCLLTKLCQDGYYLYKECSLEAAVYRFEYALRRLSELEKELLVSNKLRLSELTGPLPPVARQLKHQMYLGLSRCERKRRFYKRALEFAHMAILADSTAYEGFYSKALILKELGHTDDALLAVHQTSWLLERTIALARSDVSELEHSHEALMLAKLSARNPRMQQPCTAAGPRHNTGNTYAAPDAECQRAELLAQLDYLEETRRFVGRLRADIMDHKLRGPGGACGAHASPAPGQPRNEPQCDTTAG